MTRRAAQRALIAATALSYRNAGRFAWHFARGKLAADPVFGAVFARDLIPSDVRLLDLGCGQGLLMAWLLTAQALHRHGEWPADWASPPSNLVLHGIDGNARDIARARAALPHGTTVECADLRNAVLPPCDVAVLLDVLHYLMPDDQTRVLRRIRTALSPGGRLLLRVGDPGGGLRFALSKRVDGVVSRIRGYGAEGLHFRSPEDWSMLLAREGFSVHAVPMERGTPFANVLHVAQLSPA